MFDEAGRTLRRRGVAALAAVVVLAGCGSATSGVAAKPSPSPVQDCRGATEADPTYAPPTGVQFMNMTVDGKLRDYRLFRPATLESGLVPLVVVLHGSPIDAAGFEDLIQFDAEATRAGFIAAYPNGCSGYWSYAERGPMAVDEDFLRQMLTQLRARFNIDPARVYVVAASAGTWVAYRLACDMADQITAIASVAGTMRLADACQPSRPVSILEMHGTEDSQHPWNGGGPHNASPVDGVIQRWVTLDGCAGGPQVSRSGITETSVWKRCSGGVFVRLDKVIGGQHTWFGSQLAPVPGEPDANSVIWSFFQGLPSRTS